MKRFVINTKRTYTKDGEEKTVWNRVGTIMQFDDGNLSLDWFVQPDTKFHVFEDKPRDMGNIPGTNQPYPSPADDMPTPF